MNKTIIELITENQNNLNKIQNEILKLKEVVNESFPKIMEVEQCSNITSAHNITYICERYNQIIHNCCSYSYINEFSVNEDNIDKVEKEIATYYKNLFEKDKMIEEKNQEAIKNNLKVRNKITEIMTLIGIPEKKTKSFFKSLNSRKMIHETTPSGWFQDLEKFVPIRSNFSTAESEYKRCMENLEKFVKNKKTQFTKERIEKEKAENEKLSIRNLAMLQVKYGVDANSGWNDVLDCILNKNKYLRVAWGLMKNRENWLEGCSYAENGIEHILPFENEVDKLIYEDINHHIENWDGDGRVFRDCEWNYFRIFQLVEDKELMKDLEIVQKYLVE
jgi:hypothetical protein